MDDEYFLDLTYEKLMRYTDNFSNENWIGDFQFGKFYRAQFPGTVPSKPMTVKIWDTSTSVKVANYLRLMREVVFLKNAELRSLPAVPIIFGHVCDGEHIAILYDFEAINTVCTQLCKDEFKWMHRIKVALWIARFVQFFHSPENLPYGPLLIRNIDAANIMLDEECNPILLDFSLMTGGGIFPDEPQHGTIRPYSKMGMDFPVEPQHAAKRPRKSTGELDDIFGFGRLLLCLISKQVIRKEEDVESMIAQWNNEIELKSTSVNLVHRSFFEGETHFYDYDGSQVSSLVMECLCSVPDKRPSMEQVVERLEKLQIVQKHVDLLEFKPKRLHKSWSYL